MPDEQQVSPRNWQGKIACQYVNKDLRLDTTQIKTSTNSYVCTLVTGGEAMLNYEGKLIRISAGDMVILAPFTPPVVENASEDYEGICLIVSSEFANETRNISDLLHTLVLSISHANNPVTPLTKEEGKNMEQILHLTMRHIQRDDAYTFDSLQCLYGLYLSDMMSIMSSRGADKVSSLNTYKIFIRFSELLQQNFREHHDITFYADQLGISPRYLSMVTKELTNNTVASFINKKLMYEACWLLKTTDDSISDISKKLHFSDQASFSKFFKRVNGKNPLQYRKE